MDDPTVEYVMETGVRVFGDGTIDEHIEELDGHRVPDLTFLCVFSRGQYQVWIRRSAVLALIGHNQAE